jgi:hypothetical protein
MISAKSIEQAMQRIDARIDMLMARVIIVEEHIRAIRQQSATAHDASYRTRSQAEGWEGEGTDAESR